MLLESPAFVDPKGDPGKRLFLASVMLEKNQDRASSIENNDRRVSVVLTTCG